MFGVGWTEMLVVGVVALIVIGPKDLPIVMQRLGKMVATVRRLGGEFQREINKTTGLDQITDLRRSITEPLRSVASELTRDFNKVTSTGEVVPSGAIAPKDPASESVVAEIHEKVGMTPPPLPSAPQPAAAPAAPAVSVESPAPAEAIRPAKKAAPRKPRAKLATPAEPPVVAAAAPAKAPARKKPAAPRKPRATRPKGEA
jgi:sec-independent protein translocase protein TatB